jgi:hypothetical protein
MRVCVVEREMEGEQAHLLLCLVHVVHVPGHALHPGWDGPPLRAHLLYHRRPGALGLVLLLRRCRRRRHNLRRCPRRPRPGRRRQGRHGLSVVRLPLAGARLLARPSFLGLLLGRRQQGDPHVRPLECPHVVGAVAAHQRVQAHGPQRLDNQLLLLGRHARKYLRGG